MRKALVALVVVLGLAIPTAAFASDYRSDDQDNNQSDDNSFQPGDDQTQSRHNHLDELYDDITGIMIPPIAIKPGHHPDPHLFPLPNIQNPDAYLDQQNLLPDVITDSLTGVSDPSSEFMTTTLSDTKVTKMSVNPVRNKPVQIKNAVITTKTPSEEFTENAIYLGGALGLVAFGLVAFTGIQSARYRRKSKN